MGKRPHQWTSESETTLGIQTQSDTHSTIEFTVSMQLLDAAITNYQYPDLEHLNT